MKYDVFISYSRKDYTFEDETPNPESIVYKVLDVLEKANINYWIDKEGIYTGDEFQEVICTAIEDSRVFLFLSSANSNSSEWTPGEIQNAVDLKMPIIPFKIDDSLYNKKIRIRISPLDRIDYTVLGEKALETLIDSLQENISRIKQKEEAERRQKEEQSESFRAKLEREKRLNELRLKLEANISFIQNQIDTLQRQKGDVLRQMRDAGIDFANEQTDANNSSSDFALENDWLRKQIKLLENDLKKKEEDRELLNKRMHAIQESATASGQYRERFLEMQIRIVSDLAMQQYEQGHYNLACLLATEITPKSKNLLEPLITKKAEQALRLAWPWAKTFACHEIKNHSSCVTSAIFSPDGRIIVSASWDKTIQFWDATTGKQIGATLAHPDSVRFATFSPDGKFVATACADKCIRIWNVETRKQIGKTLEEHKQDVNTVFFSPDGTRLVSTSNDKTCLIWDLSVSNRIWAAFQGKQKVIKTDLDYSVKFASFSPDGERIVVTRWDDISIYDVHSGGQIGKMLLGHTSWINSVFFHPEIDEIILSASNDRTARLWDVKTGKQIGNPIKHEYGVTFASFSPDGKRFVTADSNGTLRLWDTATNKQIGGDMKKHTGIINTVFFSPDGSQIISASNDKTICIWDIPLSEDNRPLNKILYEIREHFKDNQLTPEQRHQYYLD